MNGTFLLPETKKLLIKVGDDAIKLNAIGEMVDGLALTVLINYLDGIGDKYINDDFDTPINETLTLILNGDFETASAKLALLLNKLIDIPYLDEETEKAAFVAGFSFIVRIIKLSIKKKQAE